MPCWGSGFFVHTRLRSALVRRRWPVSRSRRPAPAPFTSFLSVEYKEQPRGRERMTSRLGQCPLAYKAPCRTRQLDLLWGHAGGGPLPACVCPARKRRGCLLRGPNCSLVLSCVALRTRRGCILPGVSSCHPRQQGETSTFPTQSTF